MIAWRPLAVIGLLVPSVLASAPADACSMIYSPRDLTPAGRTTRAIRDLENADAVIDGEVVRVERNGEPAMVYAHRVLKGPAGPWFLVGGAPLDSCDPPLERAGERRRMILVQRPDRSMPDQYHLYSDGENARYEDRILGSDRRRDFPYFAGPR